MGAHKEMGIKLLQDELATWEAERNQKQATVNWQFTTKNARIKLVLCIPIFSRDTKKV